MAIILGDEFDNVLTGISPFGGSDSIYGFAGNDTLTGAFGADLLDGGTGADRMSGGAGDDTYLVDEVGDIVVENFATGDAAGGEDEVVAFIDFTLPNGVENLSLSDDAGSIDGTGNAGVNQLTGNARDNRLRGLAGNDLLQGGGGDDTLDGGSGSDALDGGLGNDLYFVDSTGDNANGDDGGVDTVVASVSFSLWMQGEQIERLTLVGMAAVHGTGNELANTLTGSRASNLLEGRGGADTLYGGLGNDTLDGGTGADRLVGGDHDDTYRIDSAGDQVVEEYDDIYSGTDTVVASLSTTLGFGLERLTLAGSLPLAGTGNAKGNLLLGNTGANRLDGAAGNDTVDGGSGNDTLLGGTGHDSLVGGSGSDSLVGGSGNDTYGVDSTGDRISETSTLAGEVDTVLSWTTWTLGAHLEKLTLTGSAANGTGNSLANTITGNAASNRLVGAAGNDTLDGGAGKDSLLGGDGNDVYAVDLTSDVISETGTSASTSDLVQASVSWTLGANLEKLTLTGTAVSGIGNGLANTITGNAASNRLDGAAANDTLDGGAGNDTLIGGAGNDSLVGGTGRDVFRFDTPLGSSGNVDRIVGFVAADDTIQLENAIFTRLTATGTLAEDAFEKGTVAFGTLTRILYDHATGQLWYDSDGTGAAAKVLFATLIGAPPLSAADFVIT
jgi:Ca2+-binding RTX toxin-like protein